MEKVEVAVKKVLVDHLERSPLLLLQGKGSPKKTLPLWIGEGEATAIFLTLRDIQVSRPLAYDVMKNLLEKTDRKLERVMIDDLQGGSYHAKLTIGLAGDGIKDSPVGGDGIVSKTGEIQLDARPSDAVALALKLQSPIFVSEEILQNKGLDLFFDANEDEDG